MKTLGTFVLVFVFTFISTISIAQKIAVVGGGTLSNVRTDLSDDEFIGNTRSLPGGHVGFIIDFTIKDKFSIETGAGFMTKGFRIKEEYEIFGSTIEFRSRLMAIYFEAPLLGKYTWEMEKINFYGAAGPTFGCGIYGNTKVRTGDIDEDMETQTTDLTWGSSADDDLQRFDLGLSLGGGIQYKKLHAGLSYTYGLINIGNYENDDFLRNRMMCLTVGYWFGGDEEAATK